MKRLQEEILLLRGNLALNRGDPAGARGLFTRAMAVAPSHAAAYLRAAVAEEELGEEARAAALLERAAELEERNPAIPVLRGVLYTMQGRFAEALSLLSAALERDPAEPLARAGKGLALLRSGEVEAGLALLREEMGNTSDGFQAAVLCYTEQLILDKAGAARMVESLLNPAPSEDAPREETGRGSWVSRWARRLWPKRQRAASERESGLRLLERRRYPEAEALLLKAAESSGDEEARTLLFYAYLLGGKPKKALSQLKELEKKGPSGAGLVRLRGLAELASGRRGEAVASLRRAARESTDFLDYHLSAVAALAVKDRSSARGAFRKALRFAPDGWGRQRIAAFSELGL
jgi:tetratricopeptide (TPR) repeat protein